MPGEEKVKVKRLKERTDKPVRKKVVEDPLANYTEMDLDYLFYVEGIGAGEIIQNPKKNMKAGTILEK